MFNSFVSRDESGGIFGEREILRAQVDEIRAFWLSQQIPNGRSAI